MSSVEIEFAVENGESRVQDEAGDTETERGESPASPVTAGAASRIQGQPSPLAWCS